jgi:Insect cuticle protein
MLMPFKYEWSVKDEATNNDYSHKVVSDGETQNGVYRVLLPDGRTQIVTYKADDNGYVADVEYSP